MTVKVFKNTDLSVNGRVSDAEQWLLDSYAGYGVETLDRAEDIGLGMHINQFLKKSKPYSGAKHKESFLPMSRMVDDWLYRFARGLSQWQYPSTPDGNFPDPFSLQGRQRSTQPARNVSNSEKAALPDNVVSLEERRKSL